jgi:hypothetical protein
MFPIALLNWIFIDFDLFTSCDIALELSYVVYHSVHFVSIVFSFFIVFHFFFKLFSLFFSVIVLQQKILYTHKHCEIKHIGNVRFLFSFFSI